MTAVNKTKEDKTIKLTNKLNRIKEKNEITLNKQTDKKQ